MNDERNDLPIEEPADEEVEANEEPKAPEKDGTEEEELLLPPDEPTKKKKTKTKIALRVIALVLLGVLLSGVCACSWIVFFHKPTVSEEPPYPMPPHTSDTSGGGDSGGTTVTRDRESYNFLVMGRDKVALNTDVMMIIHFDVASGDMAVMQIPRDTCAMYNGAHRKLNSIFGTFYNDAQTNGAKDPESEALATFTGFLEQNLCIGIDFSAIMNLDGFVNIVDAIGGVELDVPFNMNYEDKAQGLYIHLNKGRQTLTGKMAEQFVRFRGTYWNGDLGRVNIQKIFLAAFIQEIKSDFSVETAYTLVEQCIKYVKTDISLADCVYFVKQLLLIDLSDVTMITAPGIASWANEDGTGASFYILYRLDLITAVNEYFNLYSAPVTEDVFDMGGAFCPDKSFLAQKYHAPAGSDHNKEYNAGSIVNGDEPVTLS